ncbi:unnamed protein product, partial [Ectocarpus sp. 4 AP-2014]
MQSPSKSLTSQAGGAACSRVLHFGLAGTRGAEAPALVDYILLAEFDIDSGSTVRHAYPSSVPGVSDDWFAEHMLPEGAHNHALDWTVMFLNRDKTALDEDWPAYFDGDEPAGSADKGRSSAGVDVVGDKSYEPRLARGGEGEGEEEGGRSFLHCINLVRKQDDPTVRRGAVVKAMCICSRYNYIEVFRPMLMIALEEYYQRQVPEVLESLFEALNSAHLAGAPRPTPWERGLMRRGVADKHMGTVPVEHLAATWTYMMSFKYGERPVQASIPLYAFPDETLSPSVTLLVNLFGQNVMAIYNAVLTGRRVIFVGYNHAAGDVCKIVLAACALVSPPLQQGILHRAYPYASLSDLSFLETPSYVAGVTNPMFETHPEWWDVLCQLDLPNGSGTVITAEEAFSDGGGGGLHRVKSGGIGGSMTNTNGEDKSKTGGKDAGLLFQGDANFATKLLAGVKGGKGESWSRCECHDYTQARLRTACTRGLVNLVLDQYAGLHERLTSLSLDKTMIANEGRLRRLRISAGITERDVDPWARCRGPGGGAAACGRGVELRNCIRRIQLEKSVGEEVAAEAFELLSECLNTEAELQVLLGLLPESKRGAGLLALGLLSRSA